MNTRLFRSLFGRRFETGISRGDYCSHDPCDIQVLYETADKKRGENRSNRIEISFYKLYAFITN